MIVNKLLFHTKHYKFCCILKINNVKRFYPGGEQSINALVKNAKRVQEVIPQIHPTTMLTVYNPQIIANIKKFNHSTNPQLAALYHEQKSDTVHPEKIRTEKMIAHTTPYLQEAINNIKNQEPSIRNIKQLQDFIKYKTNTNQMISEKYLKNVLDNFNQSNTDNIITSAELHETLYLLRNYFQRTNISIENTQLFLTLWDKHHYQFMPLNTIISINKTMLKASETLAQNINDPRSYEEKKRKF